MAFPFKLPPRYVYEGPTLSGGQGDVYVCRDTYLNRKVAIKVLVDSGDTVALRKELSAIQSVRSRHVAQLYDTVRPPKGAGIGLVQEFVPGPTVNDYQSGSDPTAFSTKSPAESLTSTRQGKSIEISSQATFG